MYFQGSRARRVVDGVLDAHIMCTYIVQYEACTFHHALLSLNTLVSILCLADRFLYLSFSVTLSSLPAQQVPINPRLSGVSR